MGAGAAEGAVDAGNMMKPLLARGALRMVGATTLDEYRKHIEKDPALERRFQPVYVAPPSVEDTIAILRGLKERYELHHGVRIRDDALVAAARLSDRYIGGRFLPDKAIDLMDEAGSRLQIEIDSLPTEIDQVERRAVQLEIERKALEDEEDAASARERLAKIRLELAELRERSSSMKAKWQAERDAIGRLKTLKENADSLRTESERAKRTGNLQRAAEIDYGELPALGASLEQAEERLAELQADGTWLREEVDAEDIASVVAEWTGIPVASLVESERDRLLRLEALLGGRVIGQDEALAAVSNAVRRSRVGLQDPNRPIGSFIFLGPTGVGKTETARALAEFLFDDDRRRPHAVILFDEVEKAHADVFNILLQILDDGRLTDAQGRTVDFRNTVIIMTSNIGSQYILERSGTTPWDEIDGVVRKELHAHFRPEFLNRVDDIILFRPLSESEIRQIVDLQLARVETLAGELGVTLEVSDEAKDVLAREGFKPAFGARPLKRVIQRMVQDPLAMSLLEDEAEEGVVVRVTPATSGAGLAFERVVEGREEARLTPVPEPWSKVRRPVQRPAQRDSSDGDARRARETSASPRAQPGSW